MDEDKGQVLNFDESDKRWGGEVLSTGVFGFDEQIEVATTGVSGEDESSFHEEQRVSQEEFEEAQREREKARVEALRKYNRILILRAAGVVSFLLLFVFICRMAGTS